MLTIATLVTAMKKRRMYTDVSDEEFLNEILRPVVETANIRDNTGELLWIDKTRVSKILHHEDNIPRKIKSCLPRYGLKEALLPDYAGFLECEFDSLQRDVLIDDIEVLVERDRFISEQHKKYIQSLRGNPSAFIVECLFVALAAENRQKEILTVIWREGQNGADAISGNLFSFRSKHKPLKFYVDINSAKLIPNHTLDTTDRSKSTKNH